LDADLWYLVDTSLRLCRTLRGPITRERHSACSQTPRNVLHPSYSRHQHPFGTFKRSLTSDLRPTTRCMAFQQHIRLTGFRKVILATGGGHRAGLSIRSRHSCPVPRHACISCRFSRTIAYMKAMCRSTLLESTNEIYLPRRGSAHAGPVKWVDNLRLHENGVWVVLSCGGQISLERTHKVDLTNINCAL
jgi:hypothetical protein